MSFELPYELRIGWRHVRTSRGGRRNRFISFISGVSMLGIALGVAALIIVLRDRKSTRLNSSHVKRSRMPSSA